MELEKYLKDSFGHAEDRHFRWQTEHSVVAQRERALVREAFMPLGTRILDVGCGEGATLLHLGQPEGATGIDLFEAKIDYARKALPRCRFVTGSAYDLPFEADAFDQVIVRDLVHHLEEPARLMEQCARVLAPGGRIDVLESCRNNPLVFVHGLALRVERGELRSTMGYVRSLVERRFRVVRTARYQPLPIHRLIFHPDLGKPELATHAAFARTVDVAEALAGKVLPRMCWAYLHVRAERSGADRP